MTVYESVSRRERPNTKFQTQPELQFEIRNIQGVVSEYAYHDPGHEKTVAIIGLGDVHPMSSAIASRDGSMYQRLERVITLPDKMYGLVKIYDEQGERYVLTALAHDNEAAALALAMEPGEMITLSGASASGEEDKASWRTRLYLSLESDHMLVDHVGMGNAEILGAIDYGVENASPIAPEVWMIQPEEVHRHSFEPVAAQVA